MSQSFKSLSVSLLVFSIITGAILPVYGLEEEITERTELCAIEDNQMPIVNFKDDFEKTNVDKILTKDEYNKKIEEEKKKKEAEEKAKREKAEREKAEKEAASKSSVNYVAGNSLVQPSGSQTPYFGSNGLLVEKSSSRAQRVINLLLSIPGHRNGKSYHKSTGLDNLINQLSVEEATWVIHRIEGRGFGQTSAGYAGIDTPQSHQAFIRQQINRRYGGSVHQLLRCWGTYNYGGY